MLVPLVLAALVLVVNSTGATNTSVSCWYCSGASNTGVSTSATVLVAPVLATMVLVTGSTGATNSFLRFSC